jgi:hypothetical protein
MFYEEIFKQLNRRHIDYTVVGGVALVMHGVVRLTADLDLMLYLDEKNLNKFIDLMGELGYKPRVPVKARDLADPAKRAYWRQEKNMEVFSFYHPRQAISLIDVFISEPLPYKEIKSRAVHMKIGNLSVPVVSKEDLIKLKKIAGRPQDLEDINALRKL